MPPTGTTASSGGRLKFPASGRRDRERVYIVPTLPGIGFAFLVFAIFVLGYLQQGFAGDPQTLVIGLIVAGIVFLVETNANVSGVFASVSRVVPTRCGEPAWIEIALTNRSGKTRYDLKVRFRKAWKFEGLAEIPLLEPGETRVVRIAMQTTSRGCFPLPPVWVSSSYPVAMCFAWKIQELAGELPVFPRENFQGTRARGSFQSGTEDVSGHRPYIPGDSPTRVDWKIYARRGSLSVRTLEAPARDSIHWDDTAFIQDPEGRLAQMSAWLTESVRQHRSFDFTLPGFHFSGKDPVPCRWAMARFSIQR